MLVSDSCYKHKSEDKSGPEVELCINNDETEIGKMLKGQVYCKEIVPDEEYAIKVIICVEAVRPNVYIIFL